MKMLLRSCEEPERVVISRVSGKHLGLGINIEGVQLNVKCKTNQT